MHAYASEDPVFVAMNRLGQRATAGQLGTFCVKCHAPFADSVDLEGVPRERRGVGCIACHQAVAVDATHNGSLRWDRGGTMRGALRDVVATPAHDSKYSTLLDSDRSESSSVCGACHDVHLPNGLAIENTYAEWNASVFAESLSCSGCHMFSTGRRRHDHSFPGVDVATSAWPGIDEQRHVIARDLRPAVMTKLCVQPTGGGVQVSVILDNAQVGHAFPSGTTHARRLWVELTAETGGAVTQSIGSFQRNAVVHAGRSPEVWILGSRFFRGEEEVQFAWEADAIKSELLMPSVTVDPRDPAYYHARTRDFRLTGRPDVIRLALHEQPIGIDILETLVAAGELDPAVIEAASTHTLDGAAREWHAADGFGCVP
ncbi:hypothetical protein BH11MYX3_BH11MYX3_21730 [soil metagenome]